MPFVVVMWGSPASAELEFGAALHHAFRNVLPAATAVPAANSGIVLLSAFGRIVLQYPGSWFDRCANRPALPFTWHPLHSGGNVGPACDNWFCGHVAATSGS